VCVCVGGGGGGGSVHVEGKGQGGVEGGIRELSLKSRSYLIDYT
jgi:hypothetical protein